MADLLAHSHTMCVGHEASMGKTGRVMFLILNPSLLHRDSDPLHSSVELRGYLANHHYREATMRAAFNPAKMAVMFPFWAR